MNLLIPPLVASVLVAGYVANAAFERNSGNDRSFAADSMLRYHRAVQEQARASGTDPNDILSTTNASAPTIRPFVAVLDFKSVHARDTTDRVWTITYLDDAGYAKPSTINDQAAASIPFELARLQLREGTFGVWKDNAIQSRAGVIEFDGGLSPRIPEGMPVIASLLLPPAPSP
jgi:hypothetical protein